MSEKLAALLFQVLRDGDSWMGPLVDVYRPNLAALEIGIDGHLDCRKFAEALEKVLCERKTMRWNQTPGGAWTAGRYLVAERTDHGWNATTDSGNMILLNGTLEAAKAAAEEHAARVPEFDAQEVEKIELDSGALDVAIEAATQANVAGDDDQAQLVSAIKGYIWACRVRGLKL